jgi:hypothetical protein
VWIDLFFDKFAHGAAQLLVLFGESHGRKIPRCCTRKILIDRKNRLWGQLFAKTQLAEISG